MTNSLSFYRPKSKSADLSLGYLTSWLIKTTFLVLVGIRPAMALNCSYNGHSSIVLNWNTVCANPIMILLHVGGHGRGVHVGRFWYIAFHRIIGFSNQPCRGCVGNVWWDLFGLGGSRPWYHLRAKLGLWFSFPYNPGGKTQPHDPSYWDLCCCTLMR